MKAYRNILSLTNTPFIAVFLAFLFCLLSLNIISISINKTLSHDEHQFIASGAVLIYNGWLPYLDYPYFHAPLLTFIYGALFSSGWPLLLSARIFSCVCTVGILITIFYGVHRAFRLGGLPLRRLVALLVVLILPITMVFRYSIGYAWNHDLPMLTFMISFLLLTFNYKSLSFSKVFWAGVLFGISCSIRLSFAPLVLPFIVFILYGVGKSKGNVIQSILIFGAGLTTASLPFLLLLILYPEQTLFGNIVYPALNEAWYMARGFDRAFSLLDKIAYLINDVNYMPIDAHLLGEYGMNMIFFILGFCAIFTAIIAICKNHFLKIPFTFWLGCLPFILLGAFAPTPSQLQYYYPLTFWLALGIGWMAAYWFGIVINMLKAKYFIKYVGIALSVVLIVFAYRIVTLTPEINFSASGVGKVMAQAHKLQSVTSKGKVLTLAPIIPLEAGLDILPGFVTGPFAWRVSNQLSQETRNKMGVVSPADLDLLVKDNLPEMILTGYADFSLEKDFFHIAARFNYYAMSIPSLNRRKNTCFVLPVIMPSNS